MSVLEGLDMESEFARRILGTRCKGMEKSFAVRFAFRRPATLSLKNSSIRGLRSVKHKLQPVGDSGFK